MKSKLLSLFIFSLILISSFAQIDGHHCGFDHVHNKLKSEDSKYRIAEERLNNFIQNYKPNQDHIDLQKKSAGPKYVIPVVFHILHNGGEENISREQVVSAIDRLNECFQGTNPELSTVQPVFSSLTTTMDIEFRLATKAPNGQCFNGITRTKSSETNSGNEPTQLNAIKNGNDVYQGEWSTDEYLNIFVVTALGSAGAAAYAYFPSSSEMRRGVWTQHIYIGDTGTSTPGRSGTVVHELGHWFALYHPWGSNDLVGNDPTPVIDCVDASNPLTESDLADRVFDTPETIGNKSCNTSANTCDGDDAYWSGRGFPTPMIDNVENFMEYSYCFKMFTVGQGERMEGALDDMGSPRFNIWQESNLKKTGVFEPATICKAEFSTNRTTVCMGETVEFIDESYSNQNGWTWTFEGGTVQGSLNEQNPSVIYNAPGSYNVSLTVTDGSNNTSTTKTDYITVLADPGADSPLQEGFENITNLPDNIWSISNEFSSDYKITTDVAFSGESSLKISNSSLKEGNVYELISPTIDLSTSIAPILKFDYAFARRLATNTDNLEIQVSNDCGKTFKGIKYFPVSFLETADQTPSNFIPDSDQWKEVNLNLSSEYMISNLIFKIIFSSGGGNHFYIDNINIGDEDSFVAVNEYSLQENKFKFSPNPAENEVNLHLDLQQQANITVTIFDVLGKNVKSINFGKLPAKLSTQKLDLSTLENGTYFFNITLNGVSTSTERIIIK